MAGAGDVALITGASAGIGKATAIAFLKAGYRTVLVGRRGELLEAAIAESGVDAGNGLAVACDVTDPVAVDDLFGAIADTFGRLDVVFNNAGAAVLSTPVGDLSFEDDVYVSTSDPAGTIHCTVSR